MNKLPALGCAAAALLVGATLAACPSADPCANAPQCQDLDSTHKQTVNCEPNCPSPPCTNGPVFDACASGTSCTLVGAIPGSDLAFRDRAVCEVDSSASCDPANAAPPVCDGLGRIRGCSEYRVVMETACDEARLFFRDSACCAQPFDAGTQPGDGGTQPSPDAGIDGGA